MNTDTIDHADVEVVDSKQPLILKGSGYGLSIAPAYAEKKAELLKASAQIVSIADPDEDEAADKQIKALAAMRIEVEKSRVEVKEPALKFGKQVDATAKEFSEKITEEENRLKKIRGSYAEAVLAERQRVQRELEAKRQAEEKQRRDAEEAQRKADEAAEKLRREAEEAAFNATTPEEDAEAQRKADEAAAAEAKRIADAKAEADRIAALPKPAPVAAFVPAAPKGVKMVADFEVVQVDELYKYDLGLVDLTPRRADILARIAKETVGDVLPTIPGLRVFLKPQVR